MENPTPDGRETIPPVANPPRDGGKPSFGRNGNPPPGGIPSHGRDGNHPPVEQITPGMEEIAPRTYCVAADRSMNRTEQFKAFA
jgi:hypothetical protein